MQGVERSKPLRTCQRRYSLHMTYFPAHQILSIRALVSVANSDGGLPREHIDIRNPEVRQKNRASNSVPFPEKEGITKRKRIAEQERGRSGNNDIWIPSVSRTRTSCYATNAAPMPMLCNIICTYPTSACLHIPLTIQRRITGAMTPSHPTRSAFLMICVPG